LQPTPFDQPGEGNGRLTGGASRQGAQSCLVFSAPGRPALRDRASKTAICRVSHSAPVLKGAEIMPAVFWTGKLSSPMKLLVNINNFLAFITGNARDTAAMKQRVKLGYEGVYSNHVTHYDDFGLKHYTRIATKLLERVDLRGKEVLEIGCGTGILSTLVINQGAAKLTCGDISEYMLGLCRKKLTAQGYSAQKVDFRQLDAESLPCDNKSYDVVVSGMVLGLVPNQQSVVTEMARVLRPGGILALSTHAPECWWESSAAAFKAIPKRYTLGYRIEYWPRTGTEIQRMFVQAGLVDMQTSNLFWQDYFETGGEAYDFFASASASWWYAKFPQDKIDVISKKTRDYFEHNKVTNITHDIILAYGRKP
jgi:ubiquinone/menaquinone biosynthesis C-methylase UbiE